MPLLIKHGRLIDPATNYDAVADILIEGGMIKKIAPKINRSCDERIDAANKVIKFFFLIHLGALCDLGGEQLMISNSKIFVPSIISCLLI